MGKPEIRMSRIRGSGFRGLGGLKWTVGAVREDGVDGTYGETGATARNAALSPDSPRGGQAGQQQYNAALSSGDPHVLVWGLGGGF